MQKVSAEANKNFYIRRMDSAITKGRGESKKLKQEPMLETFVGNQEGFTTIGSEIEF